MLQKGCGEDLLLPLLPEETMGQWPAGTGSQHWRAAGNRVSLSICHDQWMHDFLVWSLTHNPHLSPPHGPLTPEIYRHQGEQDLLSPWPPHTGAWNISVFILCGRTGKIIKVVAFCLETVKLGVLNTCDFSNFAATGSLLSDSEDNAPPRESTLVLCGSLCSASTVSSPG